MTFPPHNPGPAGQVPPGPYPYPAPPRQPARPPETGTIAWAVGLAVFVLIPFISSLVAAGLMIGIGRAQRSKGPIAAANGRNAANLGLTYLLATLVLVPLHFLMLYLFTRDAPGTDFFPIGIPLTIWGVITLVFIILCIVGVVRAQSKRVFRAPALPVFRR